MTSQLNLLISHRRGQSVVIVVERKLFRRGVEVCPEVGAGVASREVDVGRRSHRTLTNDILTRVFINPTLKIRNAVLVQT